MLRRSACRSLIRETLLRLTSSFSHPYFRNKIIGVSGSIVVGDPWPGNSNGEIYSPTGRRAYSAARAAVLAGKTTRWATDLARNQIVDAETGRVPGQRGPASWFILADRFESFGRSEGWWPPDPQLSASWDVLYALQGADLEAARRKIRELEERIAELNDDRSDLLDAIEALTKSARRQPRGKRSG